METERLMRQEIERLEGLLDAGIKQALKELGNEDEAEADEAGEGQGVLMIDVARWPSKPGGPATDVWQRGYRSRKAAFLRSPAILASKERLRRRRATKARAMKTPWPAAYEY